MSEESRSAAVFQEHRALLFGVAYRMLGSVSEAEDMVQETFLRWQKQTLEDIKSAKAWLTATITRLCIDHFRSARKRREEYVGIWLPEPLVQTQMDRGDRSAGLADSLSTAFLVLLETLAPAERAVFLLREVFEYDYSEISRIVEKSEANCRQLARRAKEHVATGKPRFEAAPDHQERLVQQFIETCRQGDASALLSMLREDAALYSDGGGKVPAAPQPIFGAGKVARFLLGVSKLVREDEEFHYATINSAPGFLRYHHGHLVQSTALEIENGQIKAIYVVRNPDKLAHIGVR
jgi:RNA polymerase sigma-70 factor (ECF subfamily)